MRTRSILFAFWSAVAVVATVLTATGTIDPFGTAADDEASTSAPSSVAPLPVEPAPAPEVPVPDPAPPPPPPTLPVDRTGEYLDAMVADSMEGFDESARPVVVCVSEGILAALGGAATLEAAGVSPQLFGVADDLTELGIPIDPAVVDVVAASATSCGLGPWIAQLFVTGFSELLAEIGASVFGTTTTTIVDDADATCLRDHTGVDPRLAYGFSVGYVVADEAAAEQAFADAFGAALTDCPHTFVPYFIEVARASGLTPTPEGETCIESEVIARADRLADAFTGVSPQDAENVSIEVFRACESALGG